MTFCEAAKVSGATKFTHPHYAALYARHLPSRDETRRVLEVGIGSGVCLTLWQKWFNNAQIFGLDDLSEHSSIEGTHWRRNDPPTIVHLSGSIVCLGDQADPEAYQLLLRASGEQFDLIIDDASHNPEKTRLTLQRLWLLLKENGGVYVVEDLSSSFTTDKVEFDDTVMGMIVEEAKVMTGDYAGLEQVTDLPGLLGVSLYPNIAFLFK